jgi:acyl dehydratase
MSTVTWRVGDAIGPVLLRIDRAALVQYAGASGDFNPIHWSDAAAEQADLPGVIAHGMYVMGAAIQLVVDALGNPGAIRYYSVRFAKPVPVPPVGEAVVEVSGVVSQLTDGLATINLTAVLDGVKILGKAQVTIKIS